MSGSPSHAFLPAINRGRPEWSADMAWLLAGSLLLALAFFLPGRSDGAVRGAALVLLVAVFAGAFLVYADRKVFAAVGGGTLLAFVLARLAPGRRPSWIRFAALAVGAAFAAFALLGPAGGLF